jgi:hypothetical protein
VAEDIKACFVIAPIGAEGSEERERSDQVLQHIICPACEECGYQATRADRISEPGLITSQVIQRLIDDELVVADLTDHNANVFYELAIRHAVKKPVVQLIQSGQSIPFDVAGARTIHVDHHDLNSAAEAKKEIARQIRAVEDDPDKVDTPVSAAIQLQALRQSENPVAEIVDIVQDLRSEMLQELRSALTGIREGPEHPGVSPRLLRRLLTCSEPILRARYAVVHGEMDPARWRKLAEDFERFAHTLHRLCAESGVPPMILRDIFDVSAKAQSDERP